MQNVFHFLTWDNGPRTSGYDTKTVQRNNNNNNNYSTQYYVHLTCSQHVKARAGKSIRLIPYGINRL